MPHNYILKKDETEDKNYMKISVIRKSDNKVIYEFKQLIFGAPFTDFVWIRGEEWLISGLTYKKKIYVNCTQEKVYSCERDDSFIWTDCRVHGKYMFVSGCMWAFPYELRLVDISNFPTYKYLDMEEHFTRNLNDEETFDSEEYNYNFLSDNEIEVVDLKGNYFNTIKLD
jgi:hypothetical protein